MNTLRRFETPLTTAVTHTRSVHPLIALGAFNLDFLCVHPFPDPKGSEKLEGGGKGGVPRQGSAGPVAAADGRIG